MSETSGDDHSPPAGPPYGDDELPPPNNPETQAEQAAGLTEPIFDHHARYETELLTAEFGQPDADGLFGRSPDPLAGKPLRRDEIEGKSL